MFMHTILAVTAFVVIFIMFLVISRTLNTIINLLIKLEYIVQKEFDLKEELLEVRRLMEEQQSASESSGQPAAEKGVKISQ